MALFEMSRFMGEDEGAEENDVKDKASEILKQIEKEAKKRSKKRKSVSADTKGDSSKTIEVADDISGESGRGQKIRKTNDTVDLEQKQAEDAAADGSDTSSKHQKKKKKRKTNSNDEIIQSNSDKDDNEVSVELETEGEKSPNKKKRKGSKEKSLKTDLNVTTKTPAVTASGQNNEDSATVGSLVSEEEEEEEKEESAKTVLKDGPNEIGGFTVLGDYKPKKTEKVKRVLPTWLADPSVIGTDLRQLKLPVSGMAGLEQDLVDKLHENKITHFFPVQLHVIPILLDSIQMGHHIGRAGYRPSDICVSAPTGSGKTLAFVIPIVQALRRRVTCRVRALVVLPVRDLATQVYKVFQTYCEGTSLKVVLMIGQKTFSVEQETVVGKRLDGSYSMADVVIATPGRLVDHINMTEGFDLTALRFLVIDEADRMMDEVKQDWIAQVETAVFRGNRRQLGPLTAASCSQYDLPLQKLLYSATLSQNPEKLQQLNLFQPKLFTSVVKVMPTIKKTDTTAEGENKEGADDQDSFKTEEFTGKYTTPAGLQEHHVEVTAKNKPLMILYFLYHLCFRQVLCFTDSVEATHRLYWLIKLMGGVNVVEFSSKLHTGQRQKIINAFEAGKIDVIICSDVMARGIDLENVKYVISYDPPKFIKTYIHRIGRTARAGKPGTAVTLLQKNEFFYFKKMLTGAGMKKPKVLDIHKASLKALVPKFTKALTQLEEVLTAQKRNR